MTDAVAKELGFTKEVIVHGQLYSFHLLVRPDDTMDGRSKVWSVDDQCLAEFYFYVFEKEEIEVIE